MRTLPLIVVSIVIVTGASLALDGASFVATGKGVSGRVLSTAMRQDCGMWRLLTDPNVGTLCRDVEFAGDTVDFDTEPLAAGVLEADRAAGVGRPKGIPRPVEAKVPTDTVSSVVPLPAATSPAPNGSTRMPAHAPATTGNRDVPLSDAMLDDYRIGAGDRLGITVIGHDGLSGDFLVDELGRVSYPLLGQVDASDKTIAELQTDIRTALDRGYIVNPRVSIEVVNSLPFFILGQVNNPGGYPYIEGMTVRTAVAVAGGFTRRAKKDNVVIVRANDPERRLGDAELDAKVLPGDTVEVRRLLF